MKLLKYVAVISLVLLLTLPALAFDKNHGKFKEFEKPEDYPLGTDYYVNLEDSICNVLVLGTAEALYPHYDGDTFMGFKRGVGTFGQEGTGFHIGNGYFVTAAHVVTPSAVKMQVKTYFYYILQVDKVITQIITVGNDGLGNAPAELIWIDQEHDLALLKVIGNWPALRDYGWRTTWTWFQGYSLLEEGDALALLVRVRDEDGQKGWHYEVRLGRVVDSGVRLPEHISQGVAPWFNMADFTMDMIVYPGDSGSPIFAFDNGVPVIVGVARAVAGICWFDEDTYSVMCDWYSYASRIDQIHLKSLEVE